MIANPLFFCETFELLLMILVGRFWLEYPLVQEMQVFSSTPQTTWSSRTVYTQPQHSLETLFSDPSWVRHCLL